jgi:IclR family acetate operon transcriptional repressor
VERALAVLESVAERTGGMTNAEVHRKLKIPKSSASYILRTLTKAGYLRRDSDDRYHIGLKVVGLSHRALGGLDVREVALPIMRHLVDASQLTAHLAIYDREEAVYVEKVDAPGFVKMNTWVGRRLQLHSTSVGKALAAFLPECEAMLERRGLFRRTPQTITSITRLKRELAKVRELGFAVDEEENSLGVRCVGAPIFNSEGQIEAALGLSGTTYQFERGSVPKIAELVKAAARKISHQLGAPARR